MANYNKSFNFKQGLQVDTNNFVVSTGGLVGIGTSIPRKSLDVYGTARVNGLTTSTTLAVTGDAQFYSDVKIGTAVTISNGIVTASSYYGDGTTLSGIVGYHTTAWLLGTVGLTTTIPIGIGTDIAIDSYDLVIGTGISFLGNSGDINATGIITSKGGFIGTVSAEDLRGIISSERLSGDYSINITGLASSASSSIVAAGLTDTPDITVGNVVGTSLSGTSRISAGTGGTAFMALNSGFVGIGTSVPTSELQIRKPLNSRVEIVSDSGEAKLGIGQSVGFGNSCAVLRFGKQDHTFDIINNDIGNIRMILDSAPAGIDTGNFSWHHSTSGTSLMTLTYQGLLGVGNTNPSQRVTVGGGITASEKSYFGNGVEVSGTVKATTFDGAITLPSIISNSNINSTTGISTFTEIHVNNSSGISSIGINTNKPICDIDASSSSSNGVGFFKRIGINTTRLGGTEFPAAINADLGQNALDVEGRAKFGSIGIGTTAIVPDSINENIQVVGGNIAIYDGTLNLHRESAAIGVGSTGGDQPRSTLDLGRAAIVGSDSPALILPHVTNAQRTANVDRVSGGSTISGSIIFNIDTNQFQGWNGTSWVNLG